MGRPRRIAFWGNFGTGNWGNECTLQAIVHNAREHLPDAQLLCICSEPADTEQRHGVRAFPIGHARHRGGGQQPQRTAKPLRVLRRASLELRDWARMLSVARNLDAMVMTGTGMLTDDSEGVFGLPYDMFKWSAVAKACGSKVFFMSVGVEPIDSPIAKFFIVTALRLADYRSYRDLQSKEHLQRVGFDADGDAVYPDLAFSLPQAMTVSSPTGPRQRRRVAVGIYNYCGRGQGNAADAAAYGHYLDKVGSFIMWLLERDYDVRVIIGDLSYDEPVLGDLRRILENMGVARHRGRIDDEPAASVEEVMRQIAEVDFVVASRFHNVLLALLLGKPVVSISYNEKNDALMAEMGLSKYCQSIDRLDFDRLIAQFSDIQENAAPLRAAIAAKGTSYRDQLNEQYHIAFRRFQPG